MFDMIIAECPCCGGQMFSWYEEDAREKFKTHQCPAILLDWELEDLLNSLILNKKE